MKEAGREIDMTHAGRDTSVTQGSKKHDAYIYRVRGSEREKVQVRERGH